MVFCPECGTKIEENSRFCHECGVNVENINFKKLKTIDIASFSEKEFPVFFINSEHKRSKLKVTLYESSIDIPDIDFHSGTISRLKNFILAYNDQYLIRIDETRKVVGGKIIFINKDELFVVDELERPNDGKLAINGTFIINDWMSSNKLTGTFYAFDSNLNVLIKRKFNSNLGTNGISENGQYAVLETLNSESGDESSIFFFDLNTRDLLWNNKRDIGNIKDFKFDLNENILTVNYLNNNRKYRYSFDGKFLDRVKLEREHIEFADGYELFNIANEKIKDLKSKKTNLEDYEEVLSLLKRASNEDISHYTLAKIHRSIGEIYYKYDNRDETLKNFEIALSYDPKVGVKRKYDKIKE